jgi:hypothetical protein
LKGTKQNNKSKAAERGGKNKQRRLYIAMANKKKYDTR